MVISIFIAGHTKMHEIAILIHDVYCKCMSFASVTAFSIREMQGKGCGEKKKSKPDGLQFQPKSAT